MELGIVTIVRNDLRGLERTLESVFRQTHPPAHLIVVDGASTDGTAEWIDECAFPSYVDAISEPDQGIYDAMNKGVERSKGKYIMFLNAGDRLAAPGTIAQLDADQRRRNWSWAYGDARLVRGEHTVGTHRLAALAKPRFFAGFGTVPHQTVVMSSNLLERVGPFRLDVDLSADQELLLRAWIIAEPARVAWIVALCDATGVTSKRSPGTFARAMAGHRQRNGVSLGPPAIDRVVTNLASGFDRAKTAATGHWSERGT